MAGRRREIAINDFTVDESETDAMREDPESLLDAEVDEEDIAELSVREESLIAPTQPRQRESKSFPKESVFYATLLYGHNYSVYGMRFRQGVCQEVPMKFKQKFIQNGWFSVTDTKPRTLR